MSTNFDENKVSIFNDAQFSIQRLHYHWLYCYQFMSKGQLGKWKIQLDKIWLELYPDVMRKENTREKRVEENTQFLKNIANSDKKKLYYHLYKYHEFLRLIQHEAGKGGAYKVDEELVL